MATLSWKPKWRGDTYCSPACGGGCKRKDYNRALENAEKLAKELGPGWEPHVWENLGWWYSAHRGVLKVHPTGHKGYTAYLGSADSAGGKWAENGSTPKKAVKNVIKAARVDVDGVIAIVEEGETYAR
jgi:hypothetical protein